MRYVSVLLSLLLWMSFHPKDAAAQSRWRAVMVDVGWAGGPQGHSKSLGLDAEVGISERMRAVARWSHRSRVGILVDAENPTDSNVLEIGPGLKLSAGSRAVSYVNLLLGVHWEKDWWSSNWTAHPSGSISLGVDLRLIPPLTLRLAIRHQEVPGSAVPRKGRSNARNTGVLAGLGFSW